MNLPARILELIFGWLAPKEVISACNPVSKKWNEAHANWETLSDTSAEILKKSVLAKICEIRWSNASQIAYLRTMTNLRRIDFSDCCELTDEDLDFLLHLAKLDTLNLWGCDKLTDEGLKRVSGLTGLRNLNLGWCTGITDEGIKLIESLDNLSHLNVHGCDGITDKGILWIKSLRLSSLGL